MAVAQDDYADGDVFYNDDEGPDNDRDDRGESSLEMKCRSGGGGISVLGGESSESDASSYGEEDEEDEGAGLLTSTTEDDDDDDEGIFLPEDDEYDDLRKSKSTMHTTVDDPHAADLGGTLPSAALGIIKGMVGPAILYLPHGFASAGYLVAFPVMVLSTALFLWSSGCLLESWKAESHRVNNDDDDDVNNRKGRRRRRRRGGGGNRIALSYPALAERAFGPAGKRLVEIGISCMQSGVCLTYLIFVPQNLRASARLLFDWDVSTDRALAFMAAVQIPLSWIRDIRRLTATNLLANALISYGLATCLIFAAREVRDEAATHDDDVSLPREIVYRLRSLPPFVPSGWFLFLGTSVLLFEGSITLLVPLQEAVHAPADRDEFPNMYRRVILGVVSFYGFFGTACWMAFGDDVRTVMTTSLPPGTLATTVQLAYSLAVVFTFPLQNFPTLEILGGAVRRILSSDADERIGDNAGRNVVSTLLVLSLSVIAVSTMDDLDRVVSLMGSLLGCPLAFVVPPLIQNRLGRGRIGESRRRANVAVAVLGVGAMVISSTATLLNWK